MNRRSFLKVSAVGTVYDRLGDHGRAPETRHVILIVNGGARKKDYYESAAFAPNLRRMANEAFVFEEDHCDSVSSHDAAFLELVGGLDYRYLESLQLIPGILQKDKPRILVCRELCHDVGHDSYEEYLRSIRAMDERIGSFFDWVKNSPDFARNTAIIIRPEFGRDDEVNQHGHLHHSFGYYYTHRVARILWGPGVSPGVDRTTIINRSDLALMLAGFL